MCRPSNFKSDKLESEDEWIESFDLAKFTSDVKELGEDLNRGQGQADVNHLNKMVNWSNTCAAVGLFSMGFSVNIITIFALSTWTMTRWTMIAHHVCHGGYDKCHPNKTRWNRFKFAVGSFWNRLCDWFDWMLPEAWNVEHNNRHHYCLSEIDDPDLVEQNLGNLRDMDIFLPFKYLIIFFFMCTWKWFYYAPNTYKELKLAKLRREGKKLPKGVSPEMPVTVRTFIDGECPFYSLSEFLNIIIFPYLIIHFFLFPLPLIFIGKHFNIDGLYANALKNLFLAEIFTNIHSFIVITTNHAGNDMYRFRHPCRPFSGSFYVRQVIASVDFDYGSDIVDFLHGYLNYQIEHHLWPNLSMLSYKKSAPRVRLICEKHGIPYVKENVFIRLKKTVDIMVGNSNMRYFPEDYEKSFLEIDAELLQNKKHGSKSAKASLSSRIMDTVTETREG